MSFGCSRLPSCRGRKGSCDPEGWRSRKDGCFFTGSYARNPATGESVPIWLADYVLMEYGTGAIMAVPAHDERDFEFAETYRLPIVRVVRNPEGDDDLPFSGKDGVLVNSEQFDGLSYEDSFPAVTNWLQEKKVAEQQTQYRIHDWCISRQRYWGPPIPIIYCDACGPGGGPGKGFAGFVAGHRGFQAG